MRMLRTIRCDGLTQVAYSWAAQLMQVNLTVTRLLNIGLI